MPKKKPKGDTTQNERTRRRAEDERRVADTLLCYSNGKPSKSAVITRLMQLDDESLRKIAVIMWGD